MKKTTQVRPASKPKAAQGAKTALPKSFANAMSAMADLCYDYEKMSLGVQIKKEVQKRNELKPKTNNPVNNNAKTTVVTAGTKPNMEPMLGLKKEMSKPGECLFLLKPVLMEPSRLRNQVISFSAPRICKDEVPYEGDQCSADQLVEEPVVDFAYEGDQVTQGELGDCYLISAISCLVNMGNILNNCVEYMPPQAIAETKSFSLRLFDSGRAVQIQIQNSFPSSREWTPLFAKPVENDITVMLIQKAYAQMYGGYDKLHMGHSCDALRDLSGSPTEYIDLGDQEAFSEKLLKCFQQDYVLTASSKSETSKEFITPLHSYSVHGYKFVKKGDDNILLLKLKNPGGKAPRPFPELNEFKKQIGQDLSQPNGIFWIPYPRLRANFQVMTSCMIHPKYHYAYRCFQRTEIGAKNCGVMMLECDVAIHGYISLNQYHTRHFKGNNDYAYELGKVIVASVTESEGGFKLTETVGGGFNCKQNTSAQVSLQPGKYLIYVQLNSLSKMVPPDQCFTVSLYTSSDRYRLSKCDPASADAVQPDDMLISYMKKHQKDMSVARNEKHVRYFGTVLGYVCIYYENLSNKVMQEDLDFQVVDNVKAANQTVEVPPFGAKFVKFPIGRVNNCSHKCTFKSTTRFK